MDRVVISTTTTMPAWLPIVISTLALFIGALSLGWNIFRDVILRARVVTSVAVRGVKIANEPMFMKVFVSAVNHGPGKVRIAPLISIKNAPLWRRLFRRTQSFAVIPEFGSPLGTELPALIDVGEEVNIVYPYDEKSFLKEPVTHVGVSDSFGRMHWARRKEVRDAVKQFRKDFFREGDHWQRRAES